MMKIMMSIELLCSATDYRIIASNHLSDMQSSHESKKPCFENGTH